MGLESKSNFKTSMCIKLLVHADYNARFLKETSDVITPIMSLIFQTSLSSGNIPNDWKEASIVPVFKLERKSK